MEVFSRAGGNGRASGFAISVKALLAFIFVWLPGVRSAFCEEDASPEISVSQKERIVAQVSEILGRKAYAYDTDFSIWSQILEDQRERIGAAETEEAFARAIQEGLNQFKISHLRLFSPEGRKRSNSGTIRRLVGVFMTEEDGAFFVSRLVESSPAYEAGIRKGDTMISIDGTLIKDRPKSIPGAKSKRVKWSRGRRVFEKDIEIREHPTSDPISVRWLEDDIAVVSVMSFMGKFYRFGATNRVMREAKRANGIILDMRGNHGGFVHNSLHLANHFVRSAEGFHMRVSRRQVETIRARNGESEITREELLAEGTKGRSWGLPKQRFKGPIVILVDRHSGSGGELFPAAMKDLGKAVVIGSQTAGALLVSKSARLAHGFQLSYPVYEIAPPGGKRIEGVGLEPDIVLTARETATDSIIFERAIEVIRDWSL